MRNRTYPLPEFQTETGQCYDLPPAVVDKYFNSNVHREPRLADVAKAICARCVILDQCHADTLSRPVKGQTGIRAGLPVNQYDIARAWISYENGHRETPPRDRRPEWLARSEAAEQVEQMRTELELGVER